MSEKNNSHTIKFDKTNNEIQILFDLAFATDPSQIYPFSISLKESGSEPIIYAIHELSEAQRPVQVAILLEQWLSAQTYDIDIELATLKRIVSHLKKHELDDRFATLENSVLEYEKRLIKLEKAWEGIAKVFEDIFNREIDL